MRVNKNREEAERYIKERNYFRAALKYEELLIINPNDYYCISNLLEIKLIDCKDEYFQQHIDELQKSVVEPSEKITYYFLKIAQELFLQRIGDAKSQIQLLINYVNKNTEALSEHRWGYPEITTSKRFKELTGEAREIFENVIKFLRNSLKGNEKEAFINKDYSLAKYKKKIEEEKIQQEANPGTN